jgi:hypothetical protein
MADTTTVTVGPDGKPVTKTTPGWMKDAGGKVLDFFKNSPYTGGEGSYEYGGQTWGGTSDDSWYG